MPCGQTWRICPEFIFELNVSLRFSSLTVSKSRLMSYVYLSFRKHKPKASIIRYSRLLAANATTKRMDLHLYAYTDLHVFLIGGSPSHRGRCGCN